MHTHMHVYTYAVCLVSDLAKHMANLISRGPMSSVTNALMLGCIRPVEGAPSKHHMPCQGQTRPGVQGPCTHALVHAHLSPTCEQGAVGALTGPAASSVLGFRAKGLSPCT